MLYDDILAPVMARVEGCPRALAIEAMRNACIEFCKETMVLTTGVQVTVDGSEVPTFDLETQVVDIFDAWIGNTQVRVTHLNDMEAVDELDDGEYLIRFTDPNNIELTPPATAAAPVTLDLLLAIAPGPTSTEIHEDLWRAHSEALKHGALARLYVEPKKPWSDPVLAGFHKTEFDRAITKAAANAGRNRTQPARRLRVKPA